MKLELDDEEARRLMNALRVVLAKGPDRQLGNRW
jgi:hypothetical protein